MPVKTAKTRAKAAPRVVSEESRLADVIIGYYPIVAAAKKPIAATDKARKKLVELLSEDAAPSDELVARGSLGEVKFSECGDALVCTDLKRVHEMLGDERFYELATVAIGDLREELTARQLD